MSTKIWTAVRVPKKNLNEYLLLCRSETMPVVVEYVEQLLKNLNWTEFAPEVLADAEKTMAGWKETDPDKKSRYRRWMMVEHLGRGEFRAAAGRSQNTAFDVSACYNIWLDKRFAYIIPYGLAVLPAASYMQDYHYQNQVDPPKNISRAKYNRREKKWEEICLNDWDATRMVYSVIDFSGTAWITSIQILLSEMKILPK